MKKYLLFTALIFSTFLVGPIYAQTSGTIKWSIFLGNQYAYGIGNLLLWQLNTPTMRHKQCWDL